MNDTSANPGSSADNEHPSQTGTTEEGRSKEVLTRLLYMAVFWLLGYIAFSLAIFLGAVQFVLVLVTGNKNEELRGFSRNLIQYVWECLAFIVYVREEKPFPFGRFPSVTGRTED